MIHAFVESLRRVSLVLSQFAEIQDAGTLQWDGQAYVAASPNQFDPYAAKWWAMLTAIEKMIEGQSSSLSAKQKEYLDRLLFGGMGSLNDFALDQRRIGTKATQANEELNRLR